MKVTNVDISEAVVAQCLMYKGKHTTKKELLEAGFTEDDIRNALNSRPEYQQQYTHLQTGLVMQWYDGAWHGIYVIVKTNERFVWLKRWDDRKGKITMSDRVLKKNVAHEGYSTMPCGYNSHPVASKLIGKIVEL
jgi:hypothetical protein